MTDAAAAPIRWGWVSAGLIVAAPAVFVAWAVWVTLTAQVCSMLDVRMFGGPAIALLFGGAGATSAGVLLSRRVSALGIALVTLGVLECIGFGLEVLQYGLCIPAAP